MKKSLLVLVPLLSILLVACEKNNSNSISILPSTSNVPSISNVPSTSTSESASEKPSTSVPPSTSTSDSTSTSVSTGNSLVEALAHSREHYFGVKGQVITTYNNGSEQVDIESYDLHNIFNEKVVTNNLVYHYEIDDETFDDPYSYTYFAKDDGYAYQRELSLKNKVEDVPVSNRSSDKVKFDEYFASPFKSLAYSDLVKLNGQYLIKPKISTTFATSLVLKNVTATKVLLSVKDNKFDKVTIYTSSTSTIVSGVSSSYRFELTFNWDEETSIPEITPFDENVDGLDVLEDALTNISYSLNLSKNFTAKTMREEAAVTSVGYYYATEDAVYSNAVDSSNNSYGFKKEGGYFYEFKVETSSSGEQKVTVYDDDSVDEDLLYPDYLGFSTALFEVSDDKKTFTVHEGFESAIISLIAPYTEASYYAQYITLLEIKLNASNKFESLNFEYYDSINNIRGKATVTYENIGDTELPIQLG